MRVEKKIITQDYVARLQASPYFIVVDYRGLSVGHFGELRKRLAAGGAEVHVVKNSIFRIAAQEAGIADLAGSLDGQLAVVTGRRDVSVAAKVLKTFSAEFEKPRLKFGYLGNRRIETQELAMLADLPSLEVLRSKLLGLLQAPAGNLVRLLNTPATRMAQVLKARQEKMEAQAR
jgi:large subunit ribosomal protein L10